MATPTPLPTPDPSPVDQDLPRVVIIDSDRRVQQSLAEALRISGKVEVLGTAGDARSALELIALKEPTVVLVDPRLPDLAAANSLLNGIRMAWPLTRIVLMGWSNPVEDPGLTSRATAFVPKHAQPEEFLDAVLNACGCY
jgi:two-component system nitrate/nitrite response regulator NarL